MWLKTDKLRRSIQTPNSSMQKCSIFLRILAFFWLQFKFAINNYWNEQKHTIYSEPIWGLPSVFPWKQISVRIMVLGRTARVDSLELSPELTSSWSPWEVSMKRSILGWNEQRIKTIPTTKDSWQLFASPNQRTLLRLFMQVFCSIYFTDFSKRSISSAIMSSAIYYQKKLPNFPDSL